MLDIPLVSTIDLALEATELEDLLSYLRQTHQVDLTGYKRPCLLRRTLVRMQQVGVEHYQAYLEYLQQNPNEVEHLLNTIYINYTYFFRDRPVWDYLVNQVVPQIIASKIPQEPIRVWSAGCATGEETYSLALLLIAALGIEQFQKRVQIYGTDVDREAIQQARRGHYPAYQVEPMPPALKEQYFERRKNGYRWRQEFSPSIQFQRHNLIQDPPLPGIDLLVCRNVLMYLTEKTQVQILERFYSSLEQNGFLLLGQAENLITYPQLSLFTPIYWQGRVFTKGLPHQSHPLLSLGAFGE